MKLNRICQAMLVVFLAFAFLGGATRGFAADEIVVCIWSGEFSRTERIAYFDPFEKETGIRIKTVSNPDFAKMKAMVMTGNLEWDLVDAEEKWLIRGVKEGLFEPLDYKVIDKKELLPAAVQPYGVMSEAYNHVIWYNTNKFSEQNHPRNWKEFWDAKKFPGARSLYNNPAITLEQALVADGVSPDKLYPLDVERAFKSLDKIKPHILAWHKDTTHAQQLMTTQEVVLTADAPPRVLSMRAQGAPVAIEPNQGITDRSFWVVMKGSKQKANVMKLINYITRAKPQSDWINMYPFGVANTKAFDFVKPELLPYIPTSPENVKRQVWMNSQWWADNEAKMSEKWSEWIMKK